jgi:hypothetical protein
MNGEHTRTLLPQTSSAAGKSTWRQSQDATDATRSALRAPTVNHTTVQP